MHEPGAQAVFRVDLRAATGPVRVELAIDAGPVGLADVVPAAFALQNAIVAGAVAREEREGRAISCRAGCGACCRQLVPVSPPEALHLARLVSELPEPEQRAVRARFDAVASALDEHDLAGPLLRGDRQDAATMAPLTARYFGLALPCPFLADESCSIHAERPAGCREHLVTTPAARCAELGRSDVRVVPMPMPLSVPLARLAAERAGGAMRVIPLSLALRFAEQETELAERRWPGVDLLRRLLELTAQLRA